MKVHHAIVRSIQNNGSEINEYKDGQFVLTNDEMGLRATSDDAKFLRQLAADWANEENCDDYYVEDQIAEGEETDEEAESGSIVRDHYKKLYRERGDGSHCSDWLAVTLTGLTRNARGDFMLDAFTKIAEANGITDWQRYLTGSNGQYGLLRMSVGNRLRKIVKSTGELRTPGGVVKFKG